MIKFWSFIWIFSFVIYSCSSSKRIIDTKNPRPHLEISLNKKSYLKGEPIWIYFKLENKGKGYLLIKSKKSVDKIINERELESHISDKDGNIYPGWIMSDDKIARNVKSDTLFPGEIVNYKLNLLERHYKVPYKFPEKVLFPNTYSIFSVFSRCVLSNQVIFDIKEPEGVDSVKYELYIKGLNELKNLQKMQDIYNQLYEISGNSFYSELLLYKLILYTSLDDKNKASHLRKLFIERYPKSHYKQIVLREKL